MSIRWLICFQSKIHSFSQDLGEASTFRYCCRARGKSRRDDRRMLLLVAHLSCVGIALCQPTVGPTAASRRGRRLERRTRVHQASSQQSSASGRSIARSLDGMPDQSRPMQYTRGARFKSNPTWASVKTVPDYGSSDFIQVTSASWRMSSTCVRDRSPGTHWRSRQRSSGPSCLEQINTTVCVVTIRTHAILRDPIRSRSYCDTVSWLSSLIEGRTHKVAHGSLFGKDHHRHHCIDLPSRSHSLFSIFHHELPPHGSIWSNALPIQHSRVPDVVAHATRLRLCY